jgi:2',3'-cyclic-nucleotide 2'-phosphodiesterase/3'-nucleotidase
MLRATEFSRRETLKAGAAMAAAATLPSGLAAQSSAKLKLRVLATTDLHVNVVP